MMRLTLPQIRALRWLPADGSWTYPGRANSAAVNSLCLYCGDLVESEWGAFGKRGKSMRRYRLTKAGMVERQRRDAMP